MVPELLSAGTYTTYKSAWAFFVAYPWVRAMRRPEVWDKRQVQFPRFFCICYYGINKLNHLSKGTGESRYEKQWKEIIGYIVLVMKIMLYLEGIKNSIIVYNEYNNNN